MNSDVLSIRTVDLGRYEVCLREADSTRAFEFSVGGTPVLVVRAPEDYYRYIRFQSVDHGPLMEAILAFHRAVERGLDVPGGADLASSTVR